MQMKDANLFSSYWLTQVAADWLASSLFFFASGNRQDLVSRKTAGTALQDHNRKWFFQGWNTCGLLSMHGPPTPFCFMPQLALQNLFCFLAQLNLESAGGKPSWFCLIFMSYVSIREN